MLSCVVLKRWLDVGTTEEMLQYYLDEHMWREPCSQTAKLAMLNLQRHTAERYIRWPSVLNHYKSIACCFGRRVLKTALTHWSLRQPITAALYLA